MRGNPGWFERSTEPVLPYVGHLRPCIVLLSDGSLLAIGVARGLPHELAAMSERNSAARTLNAVWRNIAADTVTLGAHFVRHQTRSRAAEPLSSTTTSPPTWTAFTASGCLAIISLTTNGF